MAIQPRPTTGAEGIELSDRGLVELLEPEIRELVDAPSINSPTYQQFLEALGVATYTTDAAGRITFFNDAAAEFWGRRPDTRRGMVRLAPLLHIRRVGRCATTSARWRSRLARSGPSGAARRTRSDPTGRGSGSWPTRRRLFDDAGRLIGAVNVLVDVTERHRPRKRRLCRRGRWRHRMR